MAALKYNTIIVSIHNVINIIYILISNIRKTERI